MSDDDRRSPSLVASMSADRPLDALLPELTKPVEPPVPQMPVHPRVLEVETDDGWEWVFTCWSDPGSMRELHKQVLALVEATMLAELSRTPERVREIVRPRTGLRLVVFADLPWDPEAAVRAFGFRAAPWDDERFAHRLDTLRDEARSVGMPSPGRPTSMWTAPIALPPDGRADKLIALEQMMAGRLGNDVWGRTPGGPSKLFATFAKHEFGADIRPNLDGIRAFELLVGDDTPGVIRWMPALVFQALCDFIGVVAQAEFGTRIAWAECDEMQSGLAPPPVFQVVERSGQIIHVPVAHHLLRWSMMPLAEGETVPSLADWMVDQFGPRS